MVIAPSNNVDAVVFVWSDCFSADNLGNINEEIPAYKAVGKARTEPTEPVKSP